MKRLEERLRILQSARLPVVPPPSVGDVSGLRGDVNGLRGDVSGLRGEEEGGEDGVGEEGSRIAGLEMKELDPAQRRRVVMLRGRRERLEKERARLAG